MIWIQKFLIKYVRKFWNIKYQEIFNKYIRKNKIIYLNLNKQEKLLY